MKIYLLKAEANTFVVLPQLIDYLQDNIIPNRVYLGLMTYEHAFMLFLLLLSFYSSILHEDTNMEGKSYGMLLGVYMQVESLQFSGTGNVNYMYSGGYVMSYDLVEYFGKNQHLMRYYDWEDVTIGAHMGFLLRILKYY